MSVSLESGAAGDLTQLRGVGPALAEKLGKLGVHAQQDLLFVLPFRYEDRTRIVPIGGLRPGQRVVIEAEVELTEVVYRRRRTMLCTVSDRTGILTLRFFYFSNAQQKGLARGKRIRCYGEVRKGPKSLEMVHPEYRLLNEADKGALEEHLTPIYPATEGVQQARLRNLIGQLLDNPGREIQEILPAPVLEQHKLMGLDTAVRYLHRPPPEADGAALMAGKHPTQQRLALEEILAHHLSLRQIRERASTDKALPLQPRDNLVERFVDGLGFTLTGDQQAALKTIRHDLKAAHPMMRLLQGDVGCGKTVVAAAAALQAISAGQQAALMAPTELLAEQHRDNFANWLRPLGVEMVWLSGSLKGQPRQLAYEAIATGRAQLIVGTHALFQEAVEYANLALVIVDEQHRFGVHQRLALMAKGGDPDLRPHQLVMTATPIPRTLAMTMYADLDVSVIRELPPGRQPVTTVALPENRRGDIVSRVREACVKGQRAYWVCPLIEESEVLEYQDAESTYAMLTEALPELSVGLVHGRMKAADKDKVMKAFASGQHQVLVATTVIEVGVDVPEATLMIIENAERMGLAQLHQLRGRVGRGSESSVCVLLYKSPLSQLARERLAVLRETNDGFVVAQKDLELRGPGEVLGKRQTGLMHMRVADLMRDAALLPAVQQIAAKLANEYPDCIPKLIRRWIGSAAEYGSV